MEVAVRSLNDYSEKIRNVSHIITETVGTITSCSFLEDTLRPYIKKNLKEYVISHWDDGKLKEMVESFKKEAEIDMKEGWTGAVSMPAGDNVDEMKDAIVAHALNQIDNFNHEPLHCLIVNDGYSKGKLKGHMFPDVLPAFKKWVAEGKKVYTYSSGLEFSQDGLISNTVDGDISELISGCFSSSQYPKDKSESFRELCKMVDCTADKVAFLTADAATASVARKAGLLVIMLFREGNSYIGNNARESFPVISSFEDISKQICGKRKKEHDADECGEGKKAKLDETVAEEEVKPEESEKKQVGESKVESTPKEESGADKGESKVEEKEEQMEVDEQPEESTKVKEKTEEAAPVKASAPPPVEDQASSDGKEKKEEMVGAEEKVKGDIEKAEKVEEKTEVNKNDPEGAEMEVDGKKDKDKEAAECKEDSPSNKEEKKNGDKEASDVDGEKKESSVDAVDDSAKVGDESVKAEEKAEERQKGGDDEKPKENGAGDAKLVENGDSKEGVDGVQKTSKEVNGNGLNHANGDGDTGKEKTDSATVEVEKPVVKKVENAEAAIEPPTATAQESA